jgi:hypothetical protein
VHMNRSANQILLKMKAFLFLLRTFFAIVRKKYKKIFKQVEDFDRLIDLHKANTS